MEITHKELKSRMGYLLLGFFSVYLVDPVTEWVDANLQINPFIIGGIGIILTMYFFDF